jgi:hypothetical protein
MLLSQQMMRSFRNPRTMSNRFNAVLGLEGRHSCYIRCWDGLLLKETQRALSTLSKTKKAYGKSLDLQMQKSKHKHA